MLSIRFVNNYLHTTLPRWLAPGLVLAVMALPAMGQTTGSGSAAASPATQAAPRMTEKDREYALNQLKASREKFVNSVAGLSEAQLKFKTAPDRWSVSEVAEHITLTEDFLYNIYSDKVLKTTAT